MRRMLWLGLVALLLAEPADCLAWSVVPGEKMVYEVSVLGLKAKTETYFWADSVKHYIEPTGESCYRFISYNRLDCKVPFASLREGKFQSDTRVGDLTSARFSRYFIHNDKSESLSLRFDSDSAYYEKNQVTDCRGKTDSSGRAVAIGGKVHDLINILQYLRSGNLSLADTMLIESFAEDKGAGYQLPVAVAPKMDTLNVPAGKFICWHLSYLATKTGMFDGGTGDLEVWIAQDESRTVAQMRWAVKVLFRKVRITAKLKEVTKQ